MNPQFSSGNALMLFLGAVGCRGFTAEPDAFTVESERLRSATPTGARVEHVDEVVREPFRVSQEWGVAVQADWSTFAAQAVSTLSGRYRCTAEAEKAVVFPLDPRRRFLSVVRAQRRGTGACQARGAPGLSGLRPFGEVLVLRNRRLRR